MNIIPAIDLLGGKCVRLFQGRFGSEKRYADDPVAIAKKYEAQGAKYLHIVDLDGAKSGNTAQLESIFKIQRAVKLSIQVGGGIRAQQQLETIFSKGISRIVVGSLSITEPQTVKSWIKKYGQKKIVLALDVNFSEKEPLLVTHGWQVTTDSHLWSLLDGYKEIPNLQVLCTDVSRDGALTGPNIDLYRECINRYPSLQLQASGGISQLSDLTELKNIGVPAVIVGKALYEGKFTLAEAMGEVILC